MQKRWVDGLLLASVFLTAICGGAGKISAQTTREAQTTQEVTLLDGASRWDGRSFVLNMQGVSHIQRFGRWDIASRLVDYAQMHKGETFLAFEQDGVLYRLDKPAELRPLAELWQPMEHLASLQAQLLSSMAPLSAQQALLGAQQALLGAQQAALGTQLRSTRDYASVGRLGKQQGSLGREQGVIGRRQGEIGREQGVVGRQQGILGRAFYQNAQEAIDRCLKEKSCTAVGAAVPVAQP